MNRIKGQDSNLKEALATLGDRYTRTGTLLETIFGKELGRNNFPVKALRFGLDLVDSIEQNRRNSRLFRGLCE